LRADVGLEQLPKTLLAAIGQVDDRQEQVEGQSGQPKQRHPHKKALIKEAGA
jgi:hypothetical protein